MFLIVFAFSTVNNLTTNVPADNLFVFAGFQRKQKGGEGHFKVHEFKDTWNKRDFVHLCALGQNVSYETDVWFRIKSLTDFVENLQIENQNHSTYNSFCSSHYSKLIL